MSSGRRSSWWGSVRFVMITAGAAASPEDARFYREDLPPLLPGLMSVCAAQTWSAVPIAASNNSCSVQSDAGRIATILPRAITAIVSHSSSNSRK